VAEVALQAYENEIDQMIEEARYLEALAHLRHILGRYPRYLNAYYLLGKMLLEADLPDLAVDMFRRVLNADPEHFLARIGLGLAHERRGQLQAAIWNLQQAFDLAPGDEAIHDELCRLMGQDSGVTPDHIPMSRAGLARLYLRGGLFNRAVEEFRTLVAENPDRVDLQVALAEAYWRDDQIVLAAEQCQRILDVFPYCLKANLLLGTLLQNSGQESGGRYLQRAQEVDPENQVAEALFGSSSPWPRTTKTIERLLYDPAALDVDQKARWFHDLETASVSVGISEALPQMSQAEMQLVDVTASLESQIEIPDWLRELTPLEELAEGEAPEEPAEAEVAEPESTIGYEDLASWLQPTRPSVAPEPTPPAAEAVLGPTAEEEIPDWLRSLQPAGPAAIPPRPSEEEVGEEALPDWLAELQPPAAAETAAPAAQPAEAEELFGWDAFAGAPTEAAAAAGEEALEELPEWLAELQPPAAAKAPAAAEELPDWLTELQPPAAAETAVPAAQPAEAEELFGWDAFAGAPTEAAAAAGEEALEELPDWLAELQPPAAAKAPAAAEELPDWLTEFQPPAAAETAAPAAQPAEAEELFGWDAFAGAPTEAATATGEEALEELPDWLAELQPPAAAKAPAAAEELPDWLTELQPPAAAEAAAPAAQPAEAEELFGWDALAGAPTEAAAAAGEEALEELPEWLAELQPPAAAKAPAAAEELPDWLTELQPPAAAETAAPAAQPAEAEELFGWDALAGAPTEAAAAAGEEALEELPDWLAELQPPAAAKAPAAAEELPDWLTELQPPAAPAAPVAEAPEAAPVEAVAPEIAPTLEGELLSGDDALAWLASLAAGKEEELRAQAETETRARVDEIMGRKPTAPLPTPPAAPAAPVAEEIAAPVEAVAPEIAPALEGEALAAPEEAVPAGAPIVAETEEETFFGWLTFDAEVAEAPKVPEPEILEPQPLPSFGFTRFGPNGEPLMEQGPVEQGPEEIKIAGPILAEPEAVRPEMVEVEAPAIPEPAPTASLEALRARTEADARDYLTRLELARALVSANEWQEALTHYRRLIREKQQLPEIEADLTQLTGRQPDDPRLLQMLGDLHMQKGQLDQALALYKRAISLL